MTAYAVRLVLAPAALVTTEHADALIDLLRPDGGERPAQVTWERYGSERLREVTIECATEADSCVAAISGAAASVRAVLPGARIVEAGARERDR